MTTSSHSPAPFLPPKGWRGLARLALEGLAAGVFVSLVLALAVFIVAAQAEAAPLVARSASLVVAANGTPSVSKLKRRPRSNSPR